MWLSSSGADPASLATLIDSLYKHDENTQIQIQALIDILSKHTRKYKANNFFLKISPKNCLNLDSRSRLEARD